MQSSCILAYLVVICSILPAKSHSEDRNSSELNNNSTALVTTSDNTCPASGDVVFCHSESLSDNSYSDKSSHKLFSIESACNHSSSPSDDHLSSKISSTFNFSAHDLAGTNAFDNRSASEVSPASSSSSSEDSLSSKNTSIDNSSSDKLSNDNSTFVLGELEAPPGFFYSLFLRLVPSPFVANVGIILCNFLNVVANGFLFVSRFNKLKDEEETKKDQKVAEQEAVFTEMVESLRESIKNIFIRSEDVARLSDVFLHVLLLSAMNKTAGKVFSKERVLKEALAMVHRINGSEGCKHCQCERD